MTESRPPSVTLNAKEVERLARLANLALDANETRALAKDLTRILEHMANLEGLELPPEPPSASEPSRLRPDVNVESLDRQDALAEAPGRADEAFAVAGFVDEG